MFTVTFALQLWTNGKPNFLLFLAKKDIHTHGLTIDVNKERAVVSEKAER